MMFDFLLDSALVRFKVRYHTSDLMYDSAMMKKRRSLKMLRNNLQPSQIPKLREVKWIRNWRLSSKKFRKTRKTRTQAEPQIGT
jgi:hypothetical protein